MFHDPSAFPYIACELGESLRLPERAYRDELGTVPVFGQHLSRSADCLCSKMDVMAASLSQGFQFKERAVCEVLSVCSR